MFGKFGLIVLTLVFGAVAFGAGMLAPASLQQSGAQWMQQAKEAIAPKPAATASAPASLPLTPASAPAPAASMPVAAASAPAPAASEPVPAASLLLPATPAATSSYALQAGQFATDASAQQLSANIRAQGVVSTVLQVSVAGANPWSVVTVGQFNSADMALSQRDYLADKLGLPPHMRAMLLPPPPPPPAAK